MMGFNRQAIARNGYYVGNQRLVLLYGLIHRISGGNILHYRPDAYGKGSGADLATHHCLNKLFFTSLADIFLKLDNFHIGIAELCEHSVWKSLNCYPIQMEHLGPQEFAALLPLLLLYAWGALSSNDSRW